MPARLAIRQSVEVGIGQVDREGSKAPHGRSARRRALRRGLLLGSNRPARRGRVKLNSRRAVVRQSKAGGKPAESLSALHLTTDAPRAARSRFRRQRRPRPAPVQNPFAARKISAHVGGQVEPHDPNLATVNVEPSRRKPPPSRTAHRSLGNLPEVSFDNDNVPSAHIFRRRALRANPGNAQANEKRDRRQ